MNTLQTIPTSFEGLTKSQITTKAQSAVDNILEHGGALQVAETLAAMEQFIKDVRKDERFTENVREEAGKYNGKFTSQSGAKIELAEAGTTYDFSKCNDWELEHYEWQAMSAKNSIKARQDFLKSLPESGIDAVTPDGEVVKLYPPSKSSTSTYKISLSK